MCIVVPAVVEITGRRTAIPKDKRPLHKQHPIIRYNVTAHFEGEYVLLSMMKNLSPRWLTVAEVLQREKIPNSVKNVKYVVRS